MHDTSSDEGLKRVIGVRSLAINAVNLTVGAGIFALPAVVAFHLGPSAFWAYLICAGLLTLVVLCFVEIGTKVVTTGGVYAYAEEAFGPLIGFLINTLYWLGFTTLSGAAVANVMADNLSVLLPGLSTPIYRTLFLLAVYGGLAWINVIGSKESSVFVSGITVLKLLPLLLLIGVGIAYVDVDNLTQQFRRGRADFIFCFWRRRRMYPFSFR